MDYEQELRKAKTISDIFDIVKGIVMKHLGLEQAGLMVGVTDLGGFKNGFIGAFYSLEANTIIINRMPLKSILQTNPALYNYYLFHVILHEYIHSIGSYDEAQTRLLVHEISEHHFGPSHIVTQLSTNLQALIPNLIHDDQGFRPQQDASIEFVKGIDRKNINYIG